MARLGKRSFLKYIFFILLSGDEKHSTGKEANILASRAIDCLCIGSINSYEHADRDTLRIYENPYF